MVANKVDLVLRRVVSEEEGQAFANANELEYFECSAVSWSLTDNISVVLFLLQKEQENIDKPFQYLAAKFLALYQTKAEQLQTLVSH